MPNPPSLARQHAIGGAVGVLLLVFALGWRFFPVALKVAPVVVLKSQPAITAGAPEAVTRKTPHLTRKQSALNAGPPVSLAPPAVLAARAQMTVIGEHEGQGKVAKLLAQAGQAARSGKLTGPGPDTTLSLILQAAQAAPHDRHVLAALSKLHIRLVAGAQRALASGDVNAARRDLAALKRLPADARNGTAALADRIDVAAKVQPLLAKAAALIQQGKFVGKGGDTALVVYRQVLDLDPENVVARRGLQRVQQAVLDQALSAAAQGDVAKADAALAEAATILPSSPALAAARARVAGLRRGQADNLLARAHSAFDAGTFGLAQTLVGQAAKLGASTHAFAAKISNAREYAGYQPGQVFKDSFTDSVGSGPAMVLVPRGTFRMGAPQFGRQQTGFAQPRHEVTIAKGFAMARSEVTVAEFRAFVRASGYVPDADRVGGTSSVYDPNNGRMQLRAGVDWRDNYMGQPAQDNDPVVNVSWNDAHAYAEWLSQRTGEHYHLPSEAEFEYALRAGTTSPYWWGVGAPTSKVENLTGSGDLSPTGQHWATAFDGYSDGYWGPAPVMSFAPNPFGLYDMDGNVSEWVADCWHESYNRAPTNGSAWMNPGCTLRVVRGGSWASSPDQDRSSSRRNAFADTSSGRVGFRVVRSL